MTAGRGRVYDGEICVAVVAFKIIARLNQAGMMPNLELDVTQLSGKWPPVTVGQGPYTLHFGKRERLEFFANALGEIQVAGTIYEVERVPAGKKKRALR
jgi:hypothetical protein